MQRHPGPIILSDHQPTMPSHNKGSKGGFPIRKSLDQRLFAAPQGLSQRTTSFIASQRQGIHQMLFTHLIALMIHGRLKQQPAHNLPEGDPTRRRRTKAE
jgi:hypothetical protein